MKVWELRKKIRAAQSRATLIKFLFSEYKQICEFGKNTHVLYPRMFPLGIQLNSDIHTTFTKYLQPQSIELYKALARPPLRLAHRSVPPRADTRVFTGLCCDLSQCTTAPKAEVRARLAAPSRSMTSARSSLAPAKCTFGCNVCRIREMYVKIT